MITNDVAEWRELLESRSRAEHEAHKLVAAVYREHYEAHAGPIRWCVSHACRLAAASVAA
jgi:hypothetical protein